MKHHFPLAPAARKLFTILTLLCVSTFVFSIDWSGYDWIGDGAGGGTYSNKYKVSPVDGQTVVNIQKPAWADEPGIYTYGFGGGISACSLGDKCAIDGAGIVVYLSAFTAQETEVSVTVPGGTKTFTVYYVDGTTGGGDPEPDPDPTEVYDTNFASGATASAKSGNSAALAVDNNEGTRWWSATDGGMTDAQKDDQWWQVDLGRRRIFNTVQILWEGAWGKSFDICVSNDGESWTTVKEIRNQDLSGQSFPYLQIITLNDNQTARYVRFQGIARGTEYAYSFWEFRVLLPGTPVLTTFSLASEKSECEVGQETALAITALDQNSAPMDVAVEYSVSPAAAGTVTNGKYSPSRVGEATITATSGGKNAQIKVYGYSGSNVAANKGDDKVTASGYDTANNLYPRFAFDSDEGSLWSAVVGETGETRVYDAWIAVDLGAYYDINLISIRWEGACSRHYHVDFSEDNSSWRTAYNAGHDAIVTHWEYLSGTEVDNTKVRYVRIWSTEAVSQYGVKIMMCRIFGTEWVAPEDEEKPVMGSASLVSKTDVTATLSVSATDNTEVGSYHVVDAGNGIDQTITADATITVTDLAPSTTYTFTITALDLQDNESDNSVNVVVTTERDSNRPWVSAPVPVKNAQCVLSIYSDAYTSALKHDFNKNSWSWIPFSEPAIDGNSFILYNTTSAKWFALGMNQDNDEAIIAKDEYNDGTNKGLDVRQMHFLHIDIWTKGASTGPAITLNDDRLATFNIADGGWHSYDFPLSALTADKLNNVRWMKIEGFNGLNSVAIDNVYFWQEGITSNVDSWASFASAADVKVPSGVTVYSAVYSQEGTEEVLSLTDAGNVIPANTGVVLRTASASTTYAFTPATSSEAAAAASAFSDNCLVGCAVRTDISSVHEDYDVFCLRRSDLDQYQMTAFFLYTGQYIPAGKAYLKLTKASNPAPGAPRRVRLVFDQTTALDTTAAQMQVTKVIVSGQLYIIRDGVRYTVTGLKVE